MSALLRTAKVIATKLQLKDALVWIDQELDGYMDMPVEELPAYRLLTGEMQGLNTYHGWQPIRFKNAEHARLFSKAPIGISIGAIEAGFKDENGGDGSFIFGLSSEVKSQILNAVKYAADVQLSLSRGAVVHILESVRNLVLSWSLELEKAGILGENMEFSVDDKREAAPVTQQFFAQNIGFVGNVTDSAKVENEQTAALNVTLDVSAVMDFAAQARRALPLLPENARGELEPKITDIENELAKDTPDQNRLRELLGSVRTVCEGLAGNLTAHGILGLLTNLFP